MSNSDFSTTVTISDISVEVIRKNIRSLRLAVHPPEGRVSLSAPTFVSDEDIRQMLVSRLLWIKQKQAVLEQSPKPIKYQYVTGERHRYQSQTYSLRVIERQGKHVLILKENEMQLYVKPSTRTQNKALVIDRWYRQQMERQIDALQRKWQPVIKRQVTHFTVKKMKTKWGSCNIIAKRISIALSLAKKPIECLEYVLVHEMVHLHERYHNANFYRLMDHYLPDWRARDEVLRRPQS